MLEELGVTYKLHESMPSTSNVTSFNPSGKVPVLLEFDDKAPSENDSLKDLMPSFVLAESAAINTYLGESLSSSLVPNGPREKALYDQTIHFIMSEIDGQALWMYRKHVHLGKIFGFIPEIKESSKKHFHRMNRLMVEQLKTSKGDFLLGREFTAADILYVNCLNWAKSYEWDEYYTDDLEDYISRCQERPAYQRAKEIRNHSQPPGEGMKKAKEMEPSVGRSSL